MIAAIWTAIGLLAATSLRTTCSGSEVTYLHHTAATTTRGLLALADWLAAHGVTHVAMEATGVYWKPVDNIVEDHFELLVVNAQHLKAVPGRKTDVLDALRRLWPLAG